MTPMVEQAAAAPAGRDGLRATFTWTLLVLAGLLPIVLLSLYAYRVTSESVHELVVANNRSAAQMAAELVGREFENSISLGNAAATIPAMVEAVEHHDLDAVRMRLRATVQAFPRLERAFVIDTQGILWADYPVAFDSLNRSFAHRDYFRGLSRAWKPYVSEVFQRQAEPKLMVVAVAVPIRGEDRKVLGGIVYQHRLEELTRWVRHVGVGGGGYVFVVDQCGTVAAHPKLDLQSRRYAEYAALAPVEAALHGRESTVEYFDPLAQQTMVATFVPVPVAEQHWVVVAQQPVDRAYASIRRLGADLGAATGILAISTLAVVLGLGRIRQQLRLANRDLVAEIAERKQTEAALKRKERLLKQLLDIYEGQRKIVVFEIHDGIAQPLAGALMHCEASLRLLENGTPDAAREGFHKTVELLQENLGETRRLMRDLRPTILDDFGVITAVDQLIARSREEECQAIDWSHDVQFQRLAPPLETALFRIIQEGLTNALRHSGSDRVRIALVQHGDRLRVEVEDWGAGFDPADVDDSRFGLAGILERASLFAGDASIDSTPGNGTRITVEFPVVEASATQNQQE
jgi:signal transduction histidine kinase